MGETDETATGGDRGVLHDGELFPCWSWGLTDVAYTLFSVLWPEEEPPTTASIVETLEAAFEEKLRVGKEGGDDEKGVIWDAALVGEDSGQHVFIYVQECRQWFREMVRHPAAARARWFVGVQVYLGPVEPVESYVEMLQVLAKAFPDAPFVQDTAVNQCFDRGELRDVLRFGGARVREAMLCTIDSEFPGDDPEALGWVHTHGQSRSGRLELEMLEVPGRYEEEAVRVVQVVADRLLDMPTPAPGEVLPLGPNGGVVLVPWEAAAVGVPAALPGSAEYRRERCRFGHDGSRAVICAAERDGGRWSWPRELVMNATERWAAGLRTPQAAARAASGARSLWPEFERAFRKLGNPGGTDTGVRFHASFASPRGGIDAALPAEPERFEVLAINGRAVTARSFRSLLGRGPLSDCEIVELDAADVSDWSVVTPKATYGPANVGTLRLHCFLAG